MHAKASVAAVLVASLSGMVDALGSAIIKNQCSNDVYLWTVTNTPGNMQTIKSGQTFSQQYLTNPDGGGVSMKIANTPDNTGAITQYEYTVAGMLWYDVSNINGSPFTASGLTLIPSDSSCRSVACPAGVEVCSAVYNTPDENEATAACGSDADTTLVLCSGQKGDKPVASASAIAKAVNTPAVPAKAGNELAAAVTTAAPVASVAAQPNSNAATTFVTHVVTVVADAAAQVTAAPDAESAEDWSAFHHPESLGADWGYAPSKRNAHHKKAAHRHHFHRHAADSI